MSEQKITINGSLLAFEPGQTILEIAEDNGVDIPKSKITNGDEKIEIWFTLMSLK